MGKFFSLAGVYAKAQGSMNDHKGRVNRFVSRLGGGYKCSGNQEEGNMASEEEKEEFCQRSLEHYLV